MAERVRLGELLVEAKIITREQLESALELQRSDGRRLGTLLIEQQYVTETQVTQVLSQQLSVPWVSLYHIDFTRELLELVSRDLAQKHCLVPIFVRRVRGLGNTLYVAMADPTNQSAREELEKYCGLPVRLMIASPSEIRSALNAYYAGQAEASSLAAAEVELGLDEEECDEEEYDEEEYDEEEYDEEDEIDPVRPEAERTTITEQPPEADETDSEGEAAVAPGVPEPEPDSANGDDAPELEYSEVALTQEKREALERAAERAAVKQRMITLTLLDGTQVTVPAPGAKAPGTGDAQPRRWTAHDLIAALNDTSGGGSLAQKLGEDVKWQNLFAALLSVLMKKHLVADWEFVEEYQKQKKKPRKKAGD
jgi:type IV pilus assembly protein PilB